MDSAKRNCPDKSTSKKRAFLGASPDLLISLSIGLITLAVYWQVKYHEFISFDDPLYVTENLYIQGGITLKSLSWAFTTIYATNWHPLTWLSHILDVRLFGMEPGGHHLISVFLHIANALMLFYVLRKMTTALWQSAFVAALFALHPLHIESVAWAAERKDVLSTFFWMLTMWAYVRYTRQPGARSYLSVIVFFVLGLMSKPMVVTLPFIILLLDYWPLKRFQSAGRSIRLLLMEKTPLFVLSAASSSITYFAQNSGGAVVPFDQHPLAVRIINAIVSYTAYIAKMIWPSSLAVIYPYQQILPWWKVAGSCLLLIAISFLVIRSLGRHPYLAVGWLWYLATLVPVIGLVQVGWQAMADRYTYVPLIGLFIMIAWGIPTLLEQWRSKKIWLSILAATAIFIFAMSTVIQLRYWKDSITLFEHARSVTDDNYVIHNNLGFAFLNEGRNDEAITHLREVIKRNPMSALGHNNLGLALARQDKTDEAISHYLEALRIKPNYALAHNNLGLALSRQGKTEEAIKHLSKAIRIDGYYFDACYNLGGILLKQGRNDEAISVISNALRIKPDHWDAHNDIGLALLKQGRTDEAIGHFSEAIRIKPGHAAAHYNLGNILASRGNISGAVSHYSTALTTSPDCEEALNNLAWIYATNKKPEFRNGEKALQLASRVCEITGYVNPATLDTLAAAYAAEGSFEKAASTAQKAIEQAESANQGKLAEDIRKRLELYHANLPFYDSN